ncbi:MAG TPA: radical SAM protein [Terriglobia bacterium]|nr:radical SAM protein [Terriglobia bacterium]
MPAKLDWMYKRIYESVNYRLRAVAGGRWASHCRPITPLFLLTELCNAKCVHCDIWKNRGKEDSPTVDQWKRVVSDLRSWLGPVQIVFTGGEALLKPFTVDLVAHASGIGMFSEILTHGYWDDQSKIEKLALAKPWRVTISVDGVGELHTLIRGREKFWEKTHRTIETIQRIRKEHNLKTLIRLKTVIMSHNLDGACDVARFANQPGMDVFYQPIEQNYNTPEDQNWWEHSENWPRDTEKAALVVKQLIDMKREGFRIGNSYAQLEVMIPYFRNPGASRISTQSHSAHERQLFCEALNMLQFQANGDVTTCCSQKPVGNIKAASIREIWEKRPRWWESGCCLGWRVTSAEKESKPVAFLS